MVEMHLELSCERKNRKQSVGSKDTQGNTEYPVNLQGQGLLLEKRLTKEKRTLLEVTSGLVEKRSKHIGLFGNFWVIRNF